MTARPAEVDKVHTRMLRCALEVEDARAYWRHVDPADRSPRARKAFEEYWFGARSLARAETLIANFRARFDAYPAALDVLRSWAGMDPVTRSVVGHWHLQLSDPLYRAFTGRTLVDRRLSPRPEVTRDLVVGWVAEHGPAGWSMSTRIQLASKLLSAAHAAGLVATNRDPRPLSLPRVGDDALTYLVYLLKDVRFTGTLLSNPYATSVGLDGSTLEDRLRGLDALRFRRQGDLVDFGWRYADLGDWARHTVAATPAARGTP